MNMVCACVENMLDLYADGRLAASQARWVERHLGSCPACAERVASMRRLLFALRALPVPQPPADLAASIRKAVVSGRAAAEPDLGFSYELFPARPLPCRWPLASWRSFFRFPVRCWGRVSRGLFGPGGFLKRTF